MLESMDANIFSAGSLVPILTGLGFVLVCVSLWTKQEMQTAAGGSAFCGKGRYLRVRYTGMSCCKGTLFGSLGHDMVS